MVLGLKLLNNMVTVYIITYNEEVFIEFCINHYRKIFPNCIIKIYDNHSTDNTVKIAESFECEIQSYDTNNTFDEKTLLEIKNKCWKTSETVWVVVCDCDELIQITQDDLINESNKGTTLFKFIGYHMVNTGDTINIGEINLGFSDTLYDKTLLFNKRKINNIKYEPGCHISHPNGEVKYSEHRYNMLHYKYLGVEYTVSRYKLFADRLSDLNKSMRWSYHYAKHESELRQYYRDMNTRNLIKLV